MMHLKIEKSSSALIGVENWQNFSASHMQKFKLNTVWIFIVKLS